MTLVWTWQETEKIQRWDTCTVCQGDATCLVSQLSLSLRGTPRLVLSLLHETLVRLRGLKDRADTAGLCRILQDLKGQLTLN